MPTVTVIPDIFNTSAKVVYRASVGQCISDVVGNRFEGLSVQVIHRGKPIKETQEFLRSYIFSDNYDQVTIRVLPSGLGAFLTGLIIFAASTAVSFAIRALTPTPNKKLFDNSENSPTYGWDGIQNTTHNGAIIPIVYGRHKVGGQVLSSFTKVLADDHHALYELLGICAGPINAICGIPQAEDALTGDEIPTTLKINNNSAGLYADTTVYLRMGEWNQSVIEGFDDSIDGKPQNVELAYNSSYTYTTTSKVQAVDLLFRFPSGLFGQGQYGDIQQYNISIEIKYREVGATDWTTWGTKTISAMTRSQYNAIAEIRGLDAAQYEFSITRITEDDDAFHVSTVYLIGVNEITLDDVANNGIACIGIKALATEQLHGKLPTITSIVHGKECTVYQPGDDFGADTQQDFLENDYTKKLWGWYAQRMSHAALCKTHVISPRTLFFEHTTDDATSYDLSSSDVSGPFVYKKIGWRTSLYLDDMDVSVKVEAVSMSDGQGVDLVAKPPDVVNDGIQIGIVNDGGTIKWRFRTGYPAYADQTFAVSGSPSFYYLRIVKDGLSFFLYTSEDGSTWTQRGNYSQTIFWEDTNHVGIAFYDENGSSTPLQVRVSEFSFSDSDTYSIECTNNPAWVVYDILTDDHWGLGNYIDSDQIDLDSFISFASYCNEQVNDGHNETHRRFRFDGVFDAGNPAWDSVLKLLANYRAILLKQGDKIRVAWQRPQSAVQLFAISNIVKDSFSASYRAPATDANYWEVQFLNEENDYEQDYAVFVDPDMEAGEPYRRKTIQGYGITRPSEAYRLALFKAKENRYVTQSVKFQTGIDAVACEPYDVILVQHDVPQWGTAAGRVVTGTPTSINLDRQVTLEEGTTYQVTIRHEDDTIETQTVINNPGPTKTLTVSGWTRNPYPDEVWVVGPTSTVTKPFLVTQIRRTGDMECEIEAVEYQEDIYDDSTLRLSKISYSQLSDPRQMPEDVSGLMLAERAQVMKDGSVQSVVDVTWSAALGAASYDVYYREHDQENWLFAGSSQGLHFVLQGVLREDATYDVAVVSVNPYGGKRSPDVAPQSTITVEGRTERPPDVSSISISRFGETLLIRWEAVDARDLFGYEVRYSDQNSWPEATRLGSIVFGTEIVTSDFQPGNRWFMVKALNRSGIYSENAASVQESVPDRPGENIVVTRNEVTEGWDGTKTFMHVDGSELALDSNYLSGKYETPEIDAGASVNAYVTCAVTAEQNTASPTWDEATFSWDSDTAANLTWEALDDSPKITKTIEFRYGDTSGNLGSYQTFQAGYYSGRYFQFRVTIEIVSLAYGGKITNMLTQIDPPETVERGTNVSIAASGQTTISFSSFNVTPSFSAIPHGGSAGDNVVVDSVSSTQALVRYFNGSGTQVAGTIDWTAIGY